MLRTVHVYHIRQIAFGDTFCNCYCSAGNYKKDGNASVNGLCIRCVTGSEKIVKIGVSLCIKKVYNLFQENGKMKLLK